MPWLGGSSSSSTRNSDSGPTADPRIPTHVHRQAPYIPPTPRSLKVVLIGDGGAGKTSLRQRFLTGSFSRSYRATIGADFVTKTLTLDQPGQGKKKKHDAQQRVTLAVWDTAGQERFRSLGSAFYRGADAAIIAYDVTSPGSLARTVQWVRDFCEKGGLGDPDELLGVGNSSPGGVSGNLTARTRDDKKKRRMDEAEKEAARRFCWIAVGCKSDLLEQLGGGVAGSSAPAASKAKGALEWKRRFAEARRHFDALIPRDDEDGQGPAGVPLDELEEEEGYNVDGAASEGTKPSTDAPAKPEDVLARPSGDRKLVVGHGSEEERPLGAGPPPGTAPTPGKASTEAVLNQAASVPVPGAQSNGKGQDASHAPTRRANGQQAASERTRSQKKRSSIRSIDVFQPPELDEVSEAPSHRARSVGRRTSRTELGMGVSGPRRTSLSTSSSSRQPRTGEPSLSKKASFTSSIYRPPILSGSPSSTLGASPYSHGLQPRGRYDSTLSSTSMGGNSVYHTPRNSTLFGSSLRSGETVMRDAATGGSSSGEETDARDRKASSEIGRAKVDIDGEGLDDVDAEEEIEVPVKRRSMVSSSSRNSATTMRAWRDSRVEGSEGLKEEVEEETPGRNRAASGKSKQGRAEAPIPFPTSSAEAGAQAPEGLDATTEGDEDSGGTAAPLGASAAVDDDVSPEEAARLEAEMQVGDTIRLIDTGIEGAAPVLGSAGGAVVQEEDGLIREENEEAAEEGEEVKLFEPEAEASKKGKGKAETDARAHLGVINRDEDLWRGRDAPPGLGKRIVTKLWRGGEDQGDEEEGSHEVRKESHRHREEELGMTTDTLRPPGAGATGGEGREAKWRDSLLTADPESCGGSTVRGASPGPQGRRGEDDESSDGHGSDQDQSSSEDEHQRAGARNGKSKSQGGASNDTPPPVPSGFTLLLCSAKTGDGVDEVFDAVLERVGKRWRREEWEEGRLRALQAQNGIALGGGGQGKKKGWGAWNPLRQPDEEELRRGIQIAAGKRTTGGVVGACCGY